MAALGGAVIGVERQWSGHASGPAAHFAGIRTFTLLGGFAGAAGWLWMRGLEVPATILLIGAVALIIAAYFAASRHDTDATTEVAGLITVIAGVVAGIGYWELSSSMVIITAVLLIEKSRLHSIVVRIPVEGLKAGLRFALMAVVILPILPEGPYGPLGGIRPRELWMMVLLFSGISFLAYIVRAFVGERQGYFIVGILGGLISSTNVAFSFSRMREANEEQTDIPLALGVVGASTMLYLRVLASASILNPSLGLKLLPMLIPPVLAGAGYCALWFRRIPNVKTEVEPAKNPLQFHSALQMAGLFQVVLLVMYAVRQNWGEAGLLVSGAVLGLTDVDALVISMAKSAGSADLVSAAALATATGVISNKVVKTSVVIGFGRNRFRTLAASGLVLLGVVTIASMLLFR